jgi:vancomycin permeability regulator SanA
MALNIKQVHIPKVVVRCIVALLSILVIFIVVCNILVTCNSHGKAYTSVDEVGYHRFAVVLLISPDKCKGYDDPYFVNLVNTISELYKAGKISYILLLDNDYPERYGRIPISIDKISDYLSSNLPEDYGEKFIPSFYLIGALYDEDITRWRIEYEPEGGKNLINGLICARDRYEANPMLIIGPKAENQRALYLAERYGLNVEIFNVDAPQSVGDYISECYRRVKLFFEMWFSKIPKYHALEDFAFMRPMPIFFDIDGEYPEINSVPWHNEQDTIVGNFTGEGIDTLYVDYRDLFPADFYGQTGMYYAKSNNPKLPLVILYGCDAESPQLVFEGDIDGNGTDEWGYLHTWDSSQWRFYRVFTYVDNEWRYILSDTTDLLETDMECRRRCKDIMSSGGKKGYVKVTYMSQNVCDRALHDTIVKAQYTKLDSKEIIAEKWHEFSINPKKWN